MSIYDVVLMLFPTEVLTAEAVTLPGVNVYQS